jgi:CO/xanthine dehydrogenase Mo-binding subunit
MDGPAPAIANALSAALGAEVTHVPCLPEDILALAPLPEVTHG